MSNDVEIIYWPNNEWKYKDENEFTDGYGKSGYALGDDYASLRVSSELLEEEIDDIIVAKNKDQYVDTGLELNN